MRFDVVTLFPEFFTSPLAQGLVGKAIAKGIGTVVYTNPRHFTTDSTTGWMTNPTGAVPE